MQMEDMQIIGMFQARNENAIKETAVKYGRFVYSIAFNLLSNHEDSEEIVNDTYEKAWNTIPPQCPSSLSAYLGRITRNLSINHWHKQRAQKRSGGVKVLLSELHDCIPNPDTVEARIETMELVRVIDRWLTELPVDNRVLFLRRYWFGDTVNRLADEAAVSPNKLAGRLYRLRRSLKRALEKEGISL
jgi:RNA polymerase sigma factor (sigma-70 family)